MRPSKQYFCYYLKDNILIFDIFDYIEELSADLVDYLYEWNLIKENKASCKMSVIREYYNLWVSDAVISINDKLNKSNCKILCFYNEKPELNEWSKFFNDPQKILKTAKRVLKQKLPNFIEISSNASYFQTIKGTFDGIPCIIPTGEDEEFLTKTKKKLKTPIDNKNLVGKIGCHPF